MSVEVRQLARSYGDRTALKPTDLDLHPGEALGLLGPNGSGKSTLLALVAGLRVPTSGGARIDGIDVRLAAARTRLGVLIERAGLPGHLTLRSFTRGLGRALGPEVAALGLDTLTERRFATLSAGQRQRAALAIALSGDPRWLLLDEPLTALDAPTARALVAHLKERVAAGVGLLVATHRPADWATLFTRHARLDAGVLTLQAP